MRSSLLFYRVLSAANVCAALVLDSVSCRQAPFVGPDGQQNHLEKAFRTVLDIYSQIAQEFQTESRPEFTSYFKLLFSEAQAASIKQHSRTTTTSLLRRKDISYLDINAAAAGSLDIHEIYVFCNLDRFKYDSKTKTMKSVLNGVPLDWPEAIFHGCESGDGPGDQAITIGRKGKNEEKYPNRPDMMQLCPRWFYRTREGQLTWLSNHDAGLYETIYRTQNELIPDYPWPQTSYTYEHRRYGVPQGEPPQKPQYSSQKKVTETLTFILAHELTHTGNWYDPAPNPPVMPGAFPGIKGTTDIKPHPYDWNFNVQNKTHQNAQNFAFLWQGWYALTVKKLAIDFLGEWLPLNLAPFAGRTTSYSGRKPGLPQKLAPGVKPGTQGQPKPGSPSITHDTGILTDSKPQAGGQSGSGKNAQRPNTGTGGGTNAGAGTGSQRKGKGCCGIM